MRNLLSLLKKPKLGVETQVSNAADFSNNNFFIYQQHGYWVICDPGHRLDFYTIFFRYCLKTLISKPNFDSKALLMTIHNNKL